MVLWRLIDHMDASGSASLKQWNAAKEEGVDIPENVLEKAAVIPLLVACDRERYVNDVKKTCKSFLRKLSRLEEEVTTTTTRPWLWCAVMGLLAKEELQIACSSRTTHKDDRVVMDILTLSSSDASEEALCLSMASLYTLGRADGERSLGPLISCGPALCRLAKLLCSSNGDIVESVAKLAGVLVYGVTIDDSRQLWNVLNLERVTEGLALKGHWIPLVLLLSNWTYVDGDRALRVAGSDLFLRVLDTLVARESSLPAVLPRDDITTCNLSWKVMSNIVHHIFTLNEQKTYWRELKSTLNQLTRYSCRPPNLRAATSKLAVLFRESGYLRSLAQDGDQEWAVRKMATWTNDDLSPSPTYNLRDKEKLANWLELVNSSFRSSLLTGRIGTVGEKEVVVVVLYAHDCEEYVQYQLARLKNHIVLAADDEPIPLSLYTRWPMPSFLEGEDPYDQPEAELGESGAVDEATLAKLTRVGDSVAAAIEASKVPQTNICLVTTSAAVFHDRDNYRCEPQPTIAVHVWHKGFIPSGESSVAELVAHVDFEGLSLDVREGGYFPCAGGSMLEHRDTLERITIGLVTGDDQELGLITAAHCLSKNGDCRTPITGPLDLPSTTGGERSLTDYEVVFAASGSDIAALVVKSPPQWLLERPAAHRLTRLRTLSKDLFAGDAPKFRSIRLKSMETMLDSVEYVPRSQVAAKQAVFRLGGYGCTRAYLSLGKAWAVTSIASELVYLQPSDRNTAKGCLDSSELPHWRILALMTTCKDPYANAWKRRKPPLSIGELGDSGSLIGLLSVNGHILREDDKYAAQQDDVDVDVIGLGIFVGQTGRWCACFIPWGALDHEVHPIFHSNPRLAARG